MTSFWRTWLTIWCWSVGAFGLLLAGAGFPASLVPTRWLLGQMYSGGAVTFDAPLRFAVGLMGALTIGLALLIAVGARAADALGPRGGPVWRGMTWAMLAWYAIDSAISCANGFTLNAVSNTLLMAGFLAPIMASGVLKPAGSARPA